VAISAYTAGRTACRVKIRKEVTKYGTACKPGRGGKKASFSAVVHYYYSDI